MPVKFWTDEPEDTRSIEEIMANPAPIDEENEIPVTATNKKIGLRVKAGKDWGVNVGNRGAAYHDTYKNDVGTITKTSAGSAYDDFVQVRWDKSQVENWYRAGSRLGDHKPGFDLAVLED